MRKLIYLFVFICCIYPQAAYTEQDSINFTYIMQYAQEQKMDTLPLNEIVAKIGSFFIGSDYHISPIEPEGDEENLVVHLTGFDCYTLVETSLASARMIKSGKRTFFEFIEELKKIRYRGGELNGYTSRLHYFSDWIFDNSARGIVEDITKKNGGSRFNKRIYFMGSNPDKYLHLENPENHKSIKEIEKTINRRDYYFVPKEKLKFYEKKIPNGTIIGITTNINGLDISHTGIAIRKEDKKLYFLHAPSGGKKIQITQMPLAEYLKRNKTQTGVMLAFPLEP